MIVDISVMKVCELNLEVLIFTKIRYNNDNNITSKFLSEKREKKVKVLSGIR